MLQIQAHILHQIQYSQVQVRCRLQPCICKDIPHRCLQLHPQVEELDAMEYEDLYEEEDNEQ